MCLRTDQTEISIAEKDIVCYKIIIKESNRSPCYSHFLWEKDEINPVVKLELISEDPISIKEVNEGYHAYTSRKWALDKCWKYEKVVTCVIPKGSEYVLGYNVEIVASQMIWVGWWWNLKNKIKNLI